MAIPNTLLLDCYYNNTIPSFGRARDAGLRGVIHKCTEGLSFTDPLYATRKVEVTGLGMLWGAYHFIHAGDPILQADRFLRLAGNDPNTLLCVDLERDLQGHIAPLADVEAFVFHVREKTGRLPVVYTAKWVMDIINPQGRTSPLFDCPLWVASYNAIPTLPQGWKAWTLWQFTNGTSGPLPHSLPGLGHNDLEVFNGSLEEMKAFWQGTGPVAPGNGDGNLQIELMTTTATVNVRRGPSIAYPVAYQLTANTDVKMITDNVMIANGFHWLERYTYRGLWIAREFLKDKTPAPPPVTNQLKIGAHLGLGNFDVPGFLAMLARMHRAGRPMPWVKILGRGEPITPKQIKEVSPLTKVIYRIYRDTDGGPDWDAPTFFRVVDGNPALWASDYFVIPNEWNDFSPAAIKWHTDQMKWCLAHPENYPKRVLVPGWGTGNPGGDPMDTYGKQYIQDMMIFIHDNGMLFSLDEYDMGDGDWNLFRFFDHVYPYLPASLKNNMPDMVFGEIGRDRQAYQTMESIVTMYKLWNDKYNQYYFVKGGVVFLLGNTLNPQWDAFNVANNMLAFEKV